MTANAANDPQDRPPPPVGPSAAAARATSSMSSTSSTSSTGVVSPGIGVAGDPTSIINQITNQQGANVIGLGGSPSVQQVPPIDRKKDALGKMPPDVVLDLVCFRLQAADLVDQLRDLVALALEQGVEERQHSFGALPRLFHVRLQGLERALAEEGREGSHTRHLPFEDFSPKAL